MKKLAIAALGLVLIVGIFAYLLLDNLDALVENTIEKVGTELTGTGVHLDGTEIDLAKGSATLWGLKIDNPSGYSSDYAFLLDRVTIALDLASLKGAVIVLNEIIVKGARLNAEQRGASNNLSDLLDNIEGNTKQAEAVEEETKEDAPDETADVRLAVKKFVFADTEATVLSEGQEPVAIKVPDVRRNNIGDPRTGLTSAQLGDALLHAVIEEVQEAVKDHLAELAKEAAKDKVREKLGLPRSER
jgi:hypothetical protein